MLFFIKVIFFRSRIKTLQVFKKKITEGKGSESNLTAD